MIYDWSAKGDPCPECTGGRFHASSNVRMAIDNKKHRDGCVVIAVLALGAVTVLTDVIRSL